MSDETSPPDWKAALDLLLGPVIGGATRDLLRAADFEISPAEQKPWGEFIHWTNSRPRFIAGWRDDAELERAKYGRFIRGIDDARSAYAGAAYHLKQVAALEDRIHAILSSYDFQTAIPRGSVASIGRSRLADFEYQAFIFAYRRNLDYLARGLSTYFNSDTDSFRRFGKRVGGWKPDPVSVALSQCYLRHEKRLEFVLADERGASVRDRLAHKEFMPAFNINVSRAGFRLVSHEHWTDRDARGLSDLLTERLKDLHACIADMLSTFRAAVTAADGPGESPLGSVLN